MKISLLRNKISLEAKLVSFLIIALLLLDRNFSKLNIIGPIYAHDLVLFIATIITILKTSVKFKLPSIFLFIIISILYLIYSVFFIETGEGGFLMIFRHYFLFFYLACCYIISNKVFLKNKNIYTATDFIIKIAKWSVILQGIYFVYLFITVSNYSPLSGFSYFSAVGVMGIITYGAYVLIFFNGLKRFLLITLVFVMSAFLGHASSFFSLFIIYLVHFYISFTPKIRFISLAVITLVIILLFQLPQFNDANANWRLMYWGYIINNAIFENYLILGNGFGTPFISLDFAKEIYQDIGSHNMLGNNNPLVRWESPAHNSFLTIVFHVGLIPATLILVPIKSVFKQVFSQKKTDDEVKLFLTYTLIGCIVWSAFNVILELPHSAVYFWLVYFTYIYYTKNINEKT